MTEVHAEKTGDEYRIDARGHAGDTESCNYITGVLYAYAGYVANAEREGRATVKLLSTDSGRMAVICTGDAQVGAAFDAAVIGLLQLQNTRPQAIRVRI